MDGKKLVQIDAIFGLVAGIVLLFGGWIIGAAAIGDLANGGGSTLFTSILFGILKLLVLALGIVTALAFKDSNLVSNAPSVLFIVGGAVSMIPFLGWIGGIVIIVGAGLYFPNIKHFR